MKKAITAFCAAIALLMCSDVHAGAPRLRYGIEWGFTPTFFQSWHLNYISDEGYRVDDKSSEFSFTGNGAVMADFGVNITETFALSVYGGYAGITKGNRVFPLLLRASLYPAGMTEDGLFCFADCGAGFHSATPSASASTLPAAFMADAGGGYHVSLSRHIGLDFQLNLRASFDHKPIKDADTGKLIPDDDVRRNELRSYAVCLSIGLTF